MRLARLKPMLNFAHIAEGDSCFCPRAYATTSSNNGSQLPLSKVLFFIFLLYNFVNVVIVVKSLFYRLCHKSRVDAPEALSVRCILLATAPMLGKVDMVGVFVNGDLHQRVDIASTTVNRDTSLCRHIVAHTTLGAIGRNTQLKGNLRAVEFQQHPFQLRGNLCRRVGCAIRLLAKSRRRLLGSQFSPYNFYLLPQFM